MSQGLSNLLAGRRILVVEDNPLNLELALELLRGQGCRILVAEEAETGLELARAESPDLILMDIQLPGMDGLTAIGRLSENPGTRHIPVVTLSAHAMAGDREKALRMGAVGHLSKPLNTRTFIEHVARCLSGYAVRGSPDQGHPPGDPSRKGAALP
jgi:CheY-like chemotaxis protein